MVFPKRTEPLDRKDDNLAHRRFSVTVQPKSIKLSFKACVQKGEYTEDELMQMYRVIADQMHKENIHNNILMWNYIKGRTEKSFILQKKYVGMK